MKKYYLTLAAALMGAGSLFAQTTIATLSDALSPAVLVKSVPENESFEIPAETFNNIALTYDKKLDLTYASATLSRNGFDTDLSNKMSLSDDSMTINIAVSNLTNGEYTLVVAGVANSYGVDCLTDQTITFALGEDHDTSTSEVIFSTNETFAATANGTFPVGWVANDNGTIHQYGLTDKGEVWNYNWGANIGGGGCRAMTGYSGDLNGAAIFWRCMNGANQLGTLTYGEQVKDYILPGGELDSDMPEGIDLKLEARKYQITIRMCAWKNLNGNTDAVNPDNAPKYTFTLEDLEGNVYARFDDVIAMPNVNGAQYISVTNVTRSQTDFTVDKPGYYMLKFSTTQPNGEYLLGGVDLITMPSKAAYWKQQLAEAVEKAYGILDAAGDEEYDGETKTAFAAAVLEAETGHFTAPSAIQEMIDELEELGAKMQAIIKNYVYIDDNVSIEAGESADIEIGLKNELTNLVAFQMDLTLPEGIGIDNAGCSLSSRITDEEQELTVGKLENGAYRLTSSSFSLTPISGNLGKLITLKLTAADGCVGGKATIGNIRFSTAESERITLDDASFDITVKYDIVYKVDNQEYKTESVAYGAEIIPPAVVKKEGYTFSGWSEIPETMPNHDVVVTGTFTVASYTLTYQVDGEDYKIAVVAYGTPLTPEAEPTKEGYTFTGWSEIPETMPAKDVVITGNFYLYGDVNTDTEVDVVDVVDIARYVVGTPSAKFLEKLADLNADDTVNLGDAVVLVNHIAGDQSFVKAMYAPRHAEVSSEVLKLSKYGDNISLKLTTDKAYTAFQLDLVLPEDTDIEQLMLNPKGEQKHQLIYNKLEPGRYRVAVFSPANRTFEDYGDELLSFISESDNSMSIIAERIQFFDTLGNGYMFDTVGVEQETGVATLKAGTSARTDVYDLQGRKFTQPQRGVNIIRSADGTTRKVMVK